MGRWGPLVYILTNGYFWRPDGRGYTASIEQAGKWTAHTAAKIASTLGPEKQFQTIEVRKDNQ